MKKIIALILSVLMVLSLFAGCGKEETPDEPQDEVENLVVDGQEVSVKEFLIEQLSQYVKSEGFTERQKAFEEMFDQDPEKLNVTRVIELEASDLGSTQIDVHYLAVKATCQWAYEDSSFSDTLLIVDYLNGEVYDEFMVGANPPEDTESNEYLIWIMLHGALVGEGYEGGTILVDHEIRTEMSEADIAEINAAL